LASLGGSEAPIVVVVAERDIEEGFMEPYYRETKEMQCVRGVGTSKSYKLADKLKVHLFKNNVFGKISCWSVR